MGPHGHRGHCQRHGAGFGPCSCSLGKLSRLVEPTILHLLAAGKARYGYEFLELAQEEAMTDSEIDPGAVYRILRRLEQAGCVVSQWEPGQGGPQRRIYTITALGLEHLQDWATVLGRRGRAMVQFAEMCQEFAPTKG
jgi:PadR family transcriptional regulator, regulatory protein PadR